SAGCPARPPLGDIVAAPSLDDAKRPAPHGECGGAGRRKAGAAGAAAADAEPGRNGPGLCRSGGGYALTAETSISRTTLSETMTPEFSGACQSTPNSLRLMEPVAVRPMRSRS